jgi:hypothetical protein
MDKEYKEQLSVASSDMTHHSSSTASRRLGDRPGASYDATQNAAFWKEAQMLLVEPGSGELVRATPSRPAPVVLAAKLLTNETCDTG